LIGQDLSDLEREGGYWFRRSAVRKRNKNLIEEFSFSRELSLCIFPSSRWSRIISFPLLLAHVICLLGGEGAGGVRSRSASSFGRGDLLDFEIFFISVFTMRRDQGRSKISDLESPFRVPWT
jgi:hypothetical protein